MVKGGDGANQGGMGKKTREGVGKFLRDTQSAQDFDEKGLTEVAKAFRKHAAEEVGDGRSKN